MTDTPAPVTMTPEVAAALREPFPPSAIGILPKPYRKDSQKGHCNECGGWHGLPAVHLDYVGHAAVTDRLLAVDPAWTWEPVAWTEHGTPLVEQRGGEVAMWIRLTVAGVTRLGVGTAPATTFEVDKQLISDAIRNAAMRFGVALDLWSKADLHDTTTQPVDEGDRFDEDERKALQLVNRAKAELLALTGDKPSAANMWQAILDDHPGADLTDPTTAETLLAAVRVVTGDETTLAGDA